MIWEALMVPVYIPFASILVNCGFRALTLLVASEIAAFLAASAFCWAVVAAELMASVFFVSAYDLAEFRALLAAFVQFKDTFEPNVTLPEASHEIFPPASAPAPEESSFHLKPLIPLLPIVIAPEAEV